MIECSLWLIFGLIVFFLPVFSKYIYVMISAGILFAPLLVFLAIKVTEPIVRLQKERIYKKAQKILEKSPIIKIWITGSYGKSSVKEYLWALLWVNNTIIKTLENINTEIGVSQFIIKNIPDSQAKYFICEMGAYRIWEIQKLGEIVGHDHWFLTAVGTQHVGLFGSEENIEKWKTEIALSVQNKRWRLYVNADWSNMERIVASYLQGIEPVKYWISYRDGAYSKIIKISESWSSFELSYKAKKYVLETNLIGSHHVSNLTWVLAFCIDEGIDILSFGEALMNLPLPNHTLSVTKKENITLIDDSYNLSVESLKAGIEVLLFFSGKKILMLDDILELWDIAEKTHEELGEYVGKEMKLYNIMYVWSNYRKSFIKWLEKTDYDTANILENINEIGDETTILFEWRWTQKYLHKFT